MGHNLDSELSERFKHALSVCRTCDHVMMAHSFTKQHNGRCIDAMVKVTGEHNVCKCKLFIPKDNLEFLEWASRNKDNKNESL